MNTGLIAYRYAKALLLYAMEEHEEDTVYQEMRAVVDSFRMLPQIRTILTNPVTKNSDKQELMIRMNGAPSASKSYVRFVAMLIDNNREGLLLQSARQYIDQYREQKRIYVVKFKTATESDQATVDRITRLLQEFDSCATVEYEKTVDRDIIGGFVAQVGNYRLDASVRTQLNEIARSLRG